MLYRCNFYASILDRHLYVVGIPELCRCVPRLTHSHHVAKRHRMAEFRKRKVRLCPWLPFALYHQSCYLYEPSLRPRLFLPAFFLIFRRLPLERGQVQGRFLLLLSDALGFLHQKKKSSQKSHQSHLVPLQSPKLLQPLVRNYSSANTPIPSLTSSFLLNPAASHLTTPTPSLLIVCHGRLDDGN